MRFRGDQVLAKMYFDQGNILFKIGNYDKALEKFSFAQQLDPELGNLLNVKSYLLENSSKVMKREFISPSLEFKIDLASKTQVGNLTSLAIDFQFIFEYSIHSVKTTIASTP